MEAGEEDDEEGDEEADEGGMGRDGHGTAAGVTSPTCRLNIVSSKSGQLAPMYTHQKLEEYTAAACTTQTAAHYSAASNHLVSVRPVLDHPRYSGYTSPAPAA